MSQEGTVSILPSYSSHVAEPGVHRPLPAAVSPPAASGVLNMNSPAVVVELVGAVESNSNIDQDGGGSSDEDGKGGGNGKSGGKSRRELPAGAVATLKAWLLSPEHFTHPYPTPQDQILLMQKTGIDKKQLKNWFTNARRRIWKPMLKKQLEAGKLAATGAGGGGVAMAGIVPGLMVGGLPGAAPPPPPRVMAPPPLPGSEAAHMVHHPGMTPADNMYSNFQQVLQQQQQQQQQQQLPQQQLQQPPLPLPQVQNTQQIGYDYGAQGYQQQQQQQHQQQQQQHQHQSFQTYGQQQQQPAPHEQQSVAPPHLAVSNSIGSLPPMQQQQPLTGLSASVNANNMMKTDSHAVLMELFARDQDLVRQAAGKGAAGAPPPPPSMPSMQQATSGGQQQSHVSSLSSTQPPGSMSGQTMAGASNQLAGASNQLAGASAHLAGATALLASGAASARMNMGQRQQSVTFERVLPLNAWPHFSSVSSLNNLGGTLAGVKSITNLSAADLSSQGNLNKMGNLAHVKSIENMGRGDSFAFLEVFFDDKSGMSGGSNGTSSGGGNSQRGVKRERDEDDAIGLSLDGDEGSSPMAANKPSAATSSDGNAPSITTSGAPTPAPLPDDGKDDDSDGGQLKRAYDDALAARGLISVRRSCEKLTDLALPAKMQKTLSQEYVRQHNQGQGQSVGNFFSNTPLAAPSSAASPTPNLMCGGRGSNSCLHTKNSGSQQQFLADQQSASAYHNQMNASVAAAGTNDSSSLAVPCTSTSVEVPSTTECALCGQINVDTQLRPCGHMFHGRCLKPSLQNALGPPKCPIDGTPMQSAVLAVPSASAEDKQGAVPV